MDLGSTVGMKAVKELIIIVIIIVFCIVGLCFIVGTAAHAYRALHHRKMSSLHCV